MIGTQFSAVARALPSAAALQEARVAPADSVLVESPLPGGIAQVVRFLLNTVPPWVQVSGVVLAVLAGGVLVWLLFARRRALGAWLTARSRAGQGALALGALALIVTAASAGAATWNYTQHSNDFCTGCHVMNPAFQGFATGEHKHAELSCHDCHQQPLSASARQLYLWIAERPNEIGEHAKVPNRVCETCHVTGDTATWQRIAATAGHRVHLESDSSALRDMQCVSCHGVEVHRFRPVAATCGQSNCHDASDTEIVLGKMGEQTVRHCTSCHAFTADVPALATRDSARGTLVPGRQECLGCHEMRQVLADFDEASEPHGGTCGTCHNPHAQKAPADAAGSCATAGCHANWRDEPFHTGASHRRVGARCLTCHLAHSAKVDASDCEGCHRTVRERSRLRPPLPFDTTAALRRISATTPRPAYLALAAPAAPSRLFALVRLMATRPSGPAPLGAAGAPVVADTFSHDRHTKISCIVCHETGDGHGRLTFERPRGCAICHHQAPAAARCAACHRVGEYGSPRQVSVTVAVPDRQPRTRPVEFLHSPHTSRTCVACHTTPVSLAPAPDKAQCRDCHADHHAAGRSCASCHGVVQPKAAHGTLEVAHQRCDACHTATTIAQLTPTRSFCGTCHTEMAKNHYVQKECSVCHLLTEPGAYRSRLVRPSPG